jgi:uncharacterized protein (TIGR02996 family)
MTPDDAFMQAIIESHDDTPRLVYADWLDDHGDSDRAIFIRVQVELARLPLDDPRRPGLKTSERRLQEKHERLWATPLLDIVWDWGFRRGFVEFVALPFSTPLDHADTVFQSAPVRELRLDCPALSARPAPLPRRPNPRTLEQLANLERLVRCAGLQRLTTLDLSGCRIEDDGLRRLLASPHLVQLRSLDLARTGIGSPACGACSAGPGSLTSPASTWRTTLSETRRSRSCWPPRTWAAFRP